MSKNVAAGRTPPMPKAVQMPPYPYQRDVRSHGGAVSGARPSSFSDPTQVLRGSNLRG